MQWIGHSGLARHRLGGAPDRDSLERAGRLGLDLVELDVAAAADGLVLLHDGAVPCPGQPPLRVEDASVDRLRDAVPGLLTLDEGLECLGDIPVLLDLKGGVVPPLAAWFRDRPHYAGSVAVCSDELGALLTLRYAVPAVARWRTLPYAGAGRGYRPRTALGVLGRGCLPARLPLLVREVAAAGVCLDRRVVTAAVVEAAHQRGVPVAAWTVDEARHARRMERAGVDLLTTDEPEAMRAALARR